MTFTPSPRDTTLTTI